MTGAPDTICASASPAGRGGVSIVRVSGPLAAELCQKVAGIQPRPGHIHFAAFHDADRQIIDTGLLLFFAAPASFTGEDVAEFQVHGSPVVVDLLQARLFSLGCRPARPGEFSERAFLNDKMDLVQAEAVADLIASSSAAAARMALRSLQGDFSRQVERIMHLITNLRVHVEAAIDFPDEDVDFLQDTTLSARLAELRQELAHLQARAQQGALVRDGIHVVLAGAPNTGKSTLLNALSGSDTAIVTEIPGTTRDILRHELLIDGMPVHLADTAGLRQSADPVEQEGIRRARKAMHEADRILLLVDARARDSLQEDPTWLELAAKPAMLQKLSLVANKIDLTNLAPAIETLASVPVIYLSAKHELGIELLRHHLSQCAGRATSDDGGFIARRRHLDALRRAADALLAAEQQLQGRLGDLMAEELRHAHDSLGEITGRVGSDELLGKIFSSFCIGK